MAYLVSAQISDIRLWVLDNDSTAPALTDAQYILILNHHYIRFWEQFEKRKVGSAATVLNFTAGNADPQALNIAANVFRILGAAVGSSTGTFLPPRDYYSVRNRARNESGTVDEVAIAVSSRSPSSWDVSVAIAPNPADNVAIYVLYAAYPADVAAIGDEMKLPLASSRIVTRLAAYEAARILGRDVRAMQEILKEIPDEVKTFFSLPSGGGSGGGEEGGSEGPVTP